MMRNTLPAILAIVAALAPVATQGQSRSERQRQQVRQVIVFGNDPCPRGTGGDIVVCARRPESERFRIPQDIVDPEAPAARTNLDRDQEARQVSATGIGSCSPSGPGGASGCLQQEINRSQRGMDGKAQAASDPDS